jgi:segregation and condensation protein B
MDEVNTEKLIQPEINPAIFDQIDSENRENIWREETGLDEETLCGAVETIVFMSDKPVEIKKIKKLIHDEIPLKLLYDAISMLQKDYENKRHGIRLVEVAEGFQFRTKPIYSKFVQDLFKIQGLQLTQSTLEVLAIVAYRQPVTKFDVEKIRGVDSSHLIRTLIDKRLVKISGRSEDVGRPTIYSTTSEFLDVFNLADLSSLPPEYELDEIIESQKITMKDLSNIRNGDQTKFIFDEVDEIDKLASQIRSIQTSTGFTEELTTKPKVEGEILKNPFELLESYVEKTLLKKQMVEAAGSSVVSPGGMAIVVNDLLSQVHNAPEDEEEFEMIDLETGLPLDSNDDEVLPETYSRESDADLKEDTLFSEDTQDHKTDTVTELEEKEIEAALDEAFENFKTNNKVSSEEIKSGDDLNHAVNDEKELMKTLDESNFDDLFPKE